MKFLEFFGIFWNPVRSDEASKKPVELLKFSETSTKILNSQNSRIPHSILHPNSKLFHILFSTELDNHNLTVKSHNNYNLRLNYLLEFPVDYFLILLLVLEDSDQIIQFFLEG